MVGALPKNFATIIGATGLALLSTDPFVPEEYKQILAKESSRLRAAGTKDFDAMPDRWSVRL
jgi:hypothetical protein